MSDLNMMYQNGMGSLASMMGGQQMANEQQMAAQKLRELTLQNDQTAVMNPLNAQFKQGQVAQQGAELPGVIGHSQSLGAQGQEDVATGTQRVAAKMSALSTSIGNDGMVKMGQDGEKLSHVAQIIKQLPPMMQKPAFAKAVQQYGGDMNSPMFQALMQTPDDQFQKAAESMGNGMALAGQKYKQEYVAEGAKQASHEKIATGNNETQIKVADIQAAGRVAAAKARADMLKHMNMDQKFTALSDVVAKGEATPEEKAQLEMISAQRISERTGSASAVAATVLNHPTPQQTALETAKTIAGNKGKAPAAQAASAPQLPAGYKLVGTIKGVPTYENSAGHRIQWGK